MKSLLTSTKERILSAAEQLFAETGVATTSLRTITALARVNLAAVNYHFGSKDALIEAVYERRLGPLNKARLAHLDQLEQQTAGKPLSVAQIVEAFVSPVAGLTREPGKNGLVFSKLLAQTYNEAAQYVQRLMATEHQNVMRRFKTALAAALPELSEEEVGWRLHFMSAALHHVIANTSYMQWLDGSEGSEADVRTAVEKLQPFLVAGLSGPAHKSDVAVEPRHTA